MSTNSEIPYQQMWHDMGITPEMVEQFLAWSKVKVFTQPDSTDSEFGVFYTGTTKVLRGEELGQLESAPAGDQRSR